MNIVGTSVIAGQWQTGESHHAFRAYLALSNNQSSVQFFNASDDQIGAAAEAAQQAFWDYCVIARTDRAEFLEAIAANILALGDDLVSTTEEETGLPRLRLEGERMRTVNQLTLFANLLRQPMSVVHDQAEPDRQPVPKPDTRLTYLPLGPVAVFGASNFPYAFSVLGGDTASALAAGCPVIVKAHPAHPATSEMMATAINQAIVQCGMPIGAFSMLQGDDPRVSHELVNHPLVKAVGFTGSYAVATALQKTIAKRNEPIPFYGELGSINPQILLHNAIADTGPELAASLVQSLMMAQGQFCTSPGLWLIPSDNQNFLDAVATEIHQQPSAPLLTQGILRSFQDATSRIAAMPKVATMCSNTAQQADHPVAHIFKTSAQVFMANNQLQQEVFGPCALIVEYDTHDELLDFVSHLEGQLTASVHGSKDDILANSKLLLRLQHKVGRLIYNQMPTGVEVCPSMNHGGPYPASTDVRTTSVGSKAMDRFLRPLCIQNQPQYLD